MQTPLADGMTLGRMAHGAARLSCGALLVATATSQGAVLVKDINAVPVGGATASAEVSELTDAAGTTYFSADDGSTGAELWKTNGTAAGTTLVADINPGSAGSAPRDFVPAGRFVFFAATGATGGEELYRTDGTPAGTILLKDINTRSPTAGSVIGHMIPVGDTVFFSALHDSYGEELWKSDGTPAGTVLVKDVFRGRNSSFPNYLVAVGSTVFFQADTGTNNTGDELWKSDGTTFGTVLVKDINPGRNSSSPSYLTAIGNTVFFSARDAQNGTELWKSDGTAAGTAMIADLLIGPGSSAPTGVTAVGNRVFFAANSTVGGSTSGSELHVSDGTAAGTQLVAEIQPGVAGGSPGLFTPVGNKVVFLARAVGPSGSLGIEPFVSDGTAPGTTLLRDIASGSTSSQPVGLFATGSRYVYFSANDLGNGIEVWRTDGSPAGTVLIADIEPGGSGSRPLWLTLNRGHLLFRASTIQLGAELWKLDVGASSQRVGTGCAPFGAAPHLAIGDPISGSASQLSLAHATPNSPAVLLIGVAGGPVPLPLGSGCVLYFTPPLVALPAITNPAGGMAFPVPIPGSASGFVLSVQVGVASAAGLALSNAVFLAPGV